MTTSTFKRKLSAIFMTEAVGFSSLMGVEEAATLRTLTAYQRIPDGLIRQYGGRVVEAPGDAVPAKFTRVGDAGHCAGAVQKEPAARNAEMPPGRRMQLRIGIDLGNISEEGDKIYGDRVPIAARLEAIAEAGGICISKIAFNHIETRLPLGYEYLGEQSLKKIVRPIGAYRVLLEPRVVTAQGRPMGKPAWLRVGGSAALAALAVPAISWIAVKSGWIPASGGPAGTGGAPSLTSPSPQPGSPTPSGTSAPETRIPESPPTPAKTPALPKDSAPAPGTPAPLARWSPETGRESPPSSAQMAPLAKEKPPSPLFHLIAPDTDGQRSLGELGHRQGANFSPLDGNQDGFLSRAEPAEGKTKFARRLLRHLPQLHANRDQVCDPEELTAAGHRRFRPLDKNRDGKVSPEEGNVGEPGP